MGIGFTLKTLKALNSFDINCFVLKVSKHWVSVLSYNYVWPRGLALFATLGVPNAAGSPETCRRASSHACYSTVTPICSVADLLRSNRNKPVFQDLAHTHSNDDIFNDSDKMPKHVEMVQTKCQPKIGTDKMPTTIKVWTICQPFVGILSAHCWIVALTTFVGRFSGVI